MPTPLFSDNYTFKPFLRNIGVTLENSQEAVKAAGGQLFLTGNLAIMPGVFSTGEVPRRIDFEDQGIGTYNLKTAITPDPLRDDMSLVVNVTGQGWLSCRAAAMPVLSISSIMPGKLPVSKRWR